jgi:hypothetical protein
MKLSKHYRLVGLAVLPVLVFGLLMAVQSNDDMTNPLPPNTLAPGDEGYGSPSIIPDGDTTKIQYRNILFMDSGEKISGRAVASPVSL